MPGHTFGAHAMPAAAATTLRQEHEHLDTALDRLREIADGLDDAEPTEAVRLISEANQVVSRQIVEHERADETNVYPRLAKFLTDSHGLGAMSRAHREMQHLARLLKGRKEICRPVSDQRCAARHRGN